MARLCLSLLGLFQANLDGRPVSGFETVKTRALLAYLADEPGRAHSRSTLAGLLWPERAEAAALNNLRHVLANLRHAIHDPEASPPFLLIDRETIALDSHSDCSVDTLDFRRLVDSASGRRQVAHSYLECLEQAVCLYRGDFLEAFLLGGSPDFEEWILIRREMYRSQFLDALYDLAEASLSQGEYNQVKTYTHRQISIEPWREEAHRQLIQALALGGRRCEALVQYAVCCSVLKKELGVEPSQETIQLFECIRDGTLPSKQFDWGIETGPPIEYPRTTDQILSVHKLHNLPIQLTSFIGREKEIAAVKCLFRDGSEHCGSRLVTLTGPGGTGKTRLALQTAGELLEQFPDGVWLVELAPLVDPTLVVQTIARALGMRGQTGPQAFSLLQDYLEPRHLLLIFDNCEHLVEACARLVDALLQACPKLSVLVSSREALGIAGETPFRVPPLAFPEVGELPPLETLAQTEAIRLFVERATAVLPGFTLTPMNAAAITQVCQRLDGIPLAIELAAARVTLMQVEEIVDWLGDRFHLLMGGSRAALPRYQTMRASIDWSYELLLPVERTLLQRLSVFAGGWTLEAARSVGCGEGIGASEVLELLGHLVDKSLIQTGSGAAGLNRFRMLETIRQYAHEKLVESGKVGQVRDCHQQHYLGLAETAEAKIRGPDHARIQDQLETELDNLRLGLAWSLECRGKPGCNPEPGLRLAAALLWFWQNHLHIMEGLQWLEQLLTCELEERRGMPACTGRVKNRAKALRVAGYLAIVLGESHKAVEMSEESRDLFRELGADGKHGYAFALFNLGMAAGGRGDLYPAKALLEESLALFKETEDRFGEAECLQLLGNVELGRREYERANGYYGESLARSRELGDQDGAAAIFLLLGIVAYNQFDIEKARLFTEESRLVYSAISHPFGLSMVLYHLGLFDWLDGKYEQADRYGEELLSISRHQGDMVSIAHGSVKF